MRDQNWPDMDFDNMSVSTTQLSVHTGLEDDDFDELDDVLSQFTPGQKIVNTSLPDTSSEISLSSPLSPPPPPPPTASNATTFRRARNNTRVDASAIPTSALGSTNLDTAAEAAEEELDFSRELAKGMENLMRELSAEDSTRSTDNDGSSAESVQALKYVWEQMLVKGMDGDPGLGQSSGDGGFQDKIKQAVNKLKESESSLQEPPDADFEALLGSLGNHGEGGDDKELAGLLENMMGELMSKSILYEPLSELAQNFPPYLEKPPVPLSDEDRKRYDLQLNCVRRIVAVFDDTGYDDKDTECQRKIGDLMAEMQNYGSPPSELMGPLPDLNEEGCTIT